MARLCFAAILLFFLFTLAYARSPLTTSENEVTNIETFVSIPKADIIDSETANSVPESGVASHDNSGSSSESEVATNLRLPSESDSQLPESTDVAIHSVPLKVVRFRPINRHFHLRSKLPFRLCHHHGRRFKPMRLRPKSPYGGDAIFSSGENSDFDQILFPDGVRRVPEQWIGFQRRYYPVIDHDHYARVSRFGEEKFKKHFRTVDREEEKDDEHHGEEEEKKKNKNKKNKEIGFMKRIRKFLDHF